jgi:hypothetical protein
MHQPQIKATIKYFASNFNFFINQLSTKVKLPPLCPHVSLIDLKINRLDLDGFDSKGRAGLCVWCWHSRPVGHCAVKKWCCPHSAKMSETRSLESEEKCVGPS